MTSNCPECFGVRTISCPFTAREEPIEGVCSEMIGQLLTVDWQLAEREELVALLEKMSTDVVVTFGAGNIDVVCSAVAELLKKRA